MSKTNPSIILVGNGASVGQHQIGHIIDSFDEVVRFNNYQTEGHEAFCGSKTTIWARQAGERVKERDISQFKQAVVFVTYCKWQQIIDQQAQKLHKRGYSIVGFQHSKSVGSEIGLDQPNNQWPSVGALAVGYFSSVCPPIVIHGFDSNFGHYYPYESMDSKYHDWSKERAYMETLISRGWVSRLSIPSPEPDVELR